MDNSKDIFPCCDIVDGEGPLTVTLIKVILLNFIRGEKKSSGFHGFVNIYGILCIKLSSILIVLSDIYLCTCVCVCLQFC